MPMIDDHEVRVSASARDFLLETLCRMLRIRLFEERVAALKSSATLSGAAHLSIGQEAAVVGACMAIRQSDYMTGTHRSHGHPIGKGALLGPLMAELYGKSTGVCGGKGGSMHLADFSVGSLGESGIVGGLIPAAVGAALSARMRGTDQVCLCFFGDGAVNEGVFHESANLASIWRLPVIFFCENNGYAMFTAQASLSAGSSIADRASGYAFPGEAVDGQDVIAVYDATRLAVDRARAGEGPTLIEAHTYRYADHSEFGQMRVPSYRGDDEILRWRERDPIASFVNKMLGSASLSQDEIDAIRAEVEAEVDAAVAFAEKSPEPLPEALLQDVFAS